MATRKTQAPAVEKVNSLKSKVTFKPKDNLAKRVTTESKKRSQSLTARNANSKGILRSKKR